MPVVNGALFAEALPLSAFDAPMRERLLDRFAEIERGQAGRLAGVLREEGFNGGSCLGDRQPAQARLQVEQRARRAEEEIAGDQRLADPPARRPFQPDVGPDGAAASHQRR